MEGAARGVPFQLGQVEGLGDDPFPGESGITMDQDRQHLSAAVLTKRLLASPRNPFHHRVHRFQMTGIRHHQYPQALIATGLYVSEVTRMVFDIAATHQRIRIVAVFELAEHGLVELPEDIGLYIQPSPVSHTQDEFAATAGRFVLGKHIEHGDDDFRPFDGEAFLAHISGVEELIEKRSLAELIQDAELGLTSQSGPIARWFHALLEPQSFSGVLEVQVLNPHGATVGFSQCLNQVSQSH